MHDSVLYEEVITWLNPQPGGLYIDATLGWGGHTKGIAEKIAPDGRVLAFDRDQYAISVAKERLGTLQERVTFVHSSFAEIGNIAPKLGFAQVDGIIFDLGLSSMQLDTAERGFSFRFDAPLDMRFDQSQGRTAADVINEESESALADLFWRYGEETASRKLAKAIVANRPMTTTHQLANLVTQYQPKRSHLHPATKLFQALRIYVNDELGALEKGLPAAIDLLKPAGRIAVISFHSLEDRYVKNLFRTLSQECICPPHRPICDCQHHATLQLLARKGITPSAEEIARNSRSRSARLRVAERRSNYPINRRTIEQSRLSQRNTIVEKESE